MIIYSNVTLAEATKEWRQFAPVHVLKNEPRFAASINAARMKRVRSRIWPQYCASLESADTACFTGKFAQASAGCQ